MCGYQNDQAKRIGIAMISRGEVALIVASKGSTLGLLGSEFLGPVIIVVVITTIITPILLTVVFRSEEKTIEPVKAEEEIKSYYENVEKDR